MRPRFRHPTVNALFSRDALYQQALIKQKTRRVQEYLPGKQTHFAKRGEGMKYRNDRQVIAEIRFNVYLFCHLDLKEVWDAVLPWYPITI